MSDKIKKDKRNRTDKIIDLIEEGIPYFAIKEDELFCYCRVGDIRFAERSGKDEWAEAKESEEKVGRLLLEYAERVRNTAEDVKKGGFKSAREWRDYLDELQSKCITQDE